MTFKNFSDVQLSQWGEFACQWRDAVLSNPMASPWGLNNQREVEQLLTEVFNKVVERNIRKMAFDTNSPDKFTTDGKVYASISPMKNNIHFRNGKILN